MAIKKWIGLAAVVFALYTALLVAGTAFGRIDRVSYQCEVEDGADGPTRYRAQRFAYLDFGYTFIPDESAAAQAATILFRGLQKTEFPDLSGYKARAVFYDEEDEIWIVKFWSWWKPVDPVHGDWCIAMNKSDGEVRCIWVEE